MKRSNPEHRISISPEELPEEILDSLFNNYSGFKIVKAFLTENQKALYEVTLAKNFKSYFLQIASSGKIISVKSFNNG